MVHCYLLRFLLEMICFLFFVVFDLYFYNLFFCTEKFIFFVLCKHVCPADDDLCGAYDCSVHFRKQKGFIHIFSNGRI